MMKKNQIMIAVIAIVILGGLTTYWLLSKVTKKPPKTTQSIRLHRESFEHLPGWFTALDHKDSLATFQISCKTLIRQNPESDAGGQLFELKVKDWQPACQAALKLPIKKITNQQARLFFQQWFTPVTPYKKHPVKGLFTGYYMPLLQGSLVKTSEYNVPIYGVPDNLLYIDLNQFNLTCNAKKIVGRVDGQQVVPYFTREQIDNGAIKDHAPVIVWTKSLMERLNLEIQGSGVIELPNKELLYLGYAIGNGAAYTSVGRVLIDEGILNRDTASMQAISKYLESHPKKMRTVLNHNKSFVFFKVLEKQIALGAQGVGLTSGYSLAVDRQWIPMGTPLWLNTTHPAATRQNKQVLQRLMIAQDTGGAIRGMVRGDVYWGAGKDAASIAGKMRNQGQYWLLVPKHISAVQSVKDPVIHY